MISASNSCTASFQNHQKPRRLWAEYDYCPQLHVVAGQWHDACNEGRSWPNPRWRPLINDIILADRCSLRNQHEPMSRARRQPWRSKVGGHRALLRRQTVGPWWQRRANGTLRVEPENGLVPVHTTWALSTVAFLVISLPHFKPCYWRWDTLVLVVSLVLAAVMLLVRAWDIASKHINKTWEPY